MKTPEEIKKFLENCTDKSECSACHSEWRCKHEADALAYIQQLEAELEEEKTHHQHTLECAQQFEEDWLQMKRERDALLKYLTDSHWAACDICKHEPEEGSIHACKRIREVKGGPCFEWRGLCEENGGVEDA